MHTQGANLLIVQLALASTHKRGSGILLAVVLLWMEPYEDHLHKSLIWGTVLFRSLNLRPGYRTLHTISKPTTDGVEYMAVALCSRYTFHIRTDNDEGATKCPSIVLTAAV